MIVDDNSNILFSAYVKNIYLFQTIINYRVTAVGKNKYPLGDAIFPVRDIKPPNLDETIDGTPIVDFDCLDVHYLGRFYEIPLNHPDTGKQQGKVMTNN